MADVGSPRVQRRHRGNSPSAAKTLRLRIVIVGPENCGKSCIIKRYCEKRFVSRYLPTIGIDYGATKIYVDKREISVHIFDTSGSTVFKDVRNEFYRDTHGILLVFDVARRDSFDQLSHWVREIYVELAKEGRDFRQTVLMVCANKCDCKNANASGQDMRQVDELEAKLWADLRDFPLFQTSAYSGEGINAMFHAFFSQIVRLHDDGGNGLPKTPSSARKVHLATSSASRSSSAASIGGLARTAASATTAAMTGTGEGEATSSVPSGVQPSREQAAVMTRLRQGKDGWQMLGLNIGCSKEELNKTYRKLAVLLHPDKTTVKGADEAFKLLGLARRNILKTMA